MCSDVKDIDIGEQAWLEEMGPADSKGWSLFVTPRSHGNDHT